MKVVLSAVILAAMALVVRSAPALSDGQLPGKLNWDTENFPEQRQDFGQYYRDVRTQYPQYVSPCAAASAPIPAIAPAAAYQLNIAPYHGYQYGYGPHFRSMEMMPEQEIMRFSDMDHMMSEHIPMARHNYAAGRAAYTPIVASPATTGHVFGVFPNANTGGCNVPLLFSCNPSVVQGHVVPSQPHYSYAAANGYRGVDAMAQHDSHESQSPDATVHEHQSPAHDSTHTMVHQ